MTRPYRNSCQSLVKVRQTIFWNQSSRKCTQLLPSRLTNAQNRFARKRIHQWKQSSRGHTRLEWYWNPEPRQVCLIESGSNIQRQEGQINWKICRPTSSFKQKTRDINPFLPLFELFFSQALPQKIPSSLSIPCPFVGIFLRTTKINRGTCLHMLRNLLWWNPGWRWCFLGLWTGMIVTFPQRRARLAVSWCVVVWSIWDSNGDRINGV